MGIPLEDYGKMKKKKELEILLAQLQTRRKDYGITSFDYSKIPQQQSLVNDFLARLLLSASDRIRYYLYYG
jgi:hypothetical protein